MNISTDQTKSLEAFTIKLLHLVQNTRHCQKYWNEHYGFTNKEAMKKWETKLDALLKETGLQDGPVAIKDIKITFTNPTNEQTI